VCISNSDYNLSDTQDQRENHKLICEFSGRWHYASSAQPCPVCQRIDKGCRIADDNATFICRKLDYWAKQGIQGKSGLDRNGRQFWTFHLHYHSARPLAYTPPRAPHHSPQQSRYTASPSACHAAFSALLDALDLSASHSAALTGPSRGFSRAWIAHAGYRTIPEYTARAVNCLPIPPETLGTVPGFNVYTHSNGQRRASLRVERDKQNKGRSAYTGILIPVRDVEGRILSLRTRVDNPHSGEGKYRWLGGSQTLVHVPLGTPKQCPTVILTEGELKADYVFFSKNLPCISIPGAMGFRPAFPILKQMGAQTVQIAYDADAATNPDVGGALYRLTKELIDLGYRTELLLWDARRGKGIDDLLRAGGEWTVIPHGTALARAREIAQTAGAKLTSEPPFNPQTPARPLPRPRQIEGIAPPYTPQEIPLAELSNRITAKFRTWLLSHSRTPEQKPRPLLMNVTVGAGKTHSVLGALKEIISNYEYKTIWFLTPTIAHAEELQRAYGSDSMVIYGRSRETGGSDDARKRVCPRSEVVDKVIRMVDSIQASLCGDARSENRCPFRDECLYFQQYKQARKKHVILLPHQHLTLAKSDATKLPTPDLIIIDENPLSSLLSKNGGFAPEIALEDAARDPEALPIVETIIAALREGRNYAQALSEANHASGELMRIGGALRRATLPQITPTMDDEEIKQIARRYKPNRAAQLLLTAGRDMEATLARGISYGIDYVPAKRIEGTDASGISEMIYTQYRKNIHKLYQHAPLVILDATGNPATLAPAFPDIEEYRVDVEQNLDVTQFSHWRASRSVLKPENPDSSRHLNNINAVLAQIAAAHPGQKGLLISYMDVISDAAFQGGNLRMPEGMAGHHFGDIRGTNEYENADYVIVLGRNEPAIHDIERDAKALFFDCPGIHLQLLPRGERLPEQERGYLMRDGQQIGAPVSCHPDPQINALLEQIREAETVQAIGRIRAVRAEQAKHAYIICDLPIPGLWVDRLINWKDAAAAAHGGGSDKFAQAMERLGGVLPTSRTWLAARFPDLWDNETQVRRGLEKITQVQQNHIEQKRSISNNIYYKKLTFFKNLICSRKVKYKTREARKWSMAYSSLGDDGEAERILMELHGWGDAGGVQFKWEGEGEREGERIEDKNTMMAALTLNEGEAETVAAAETIAEPEPIAAAGHEPLDQSSSSSPHEGPAAGMLRTLNVLDGAAAQAMDGSRVRRLLAMAGSAGREAALWDDVRWKIPYGGGEFHISEEAINRKLAQQPYGMRVDRVARVVTLYRLPTQ
jgi:hypothetical protein